jgi:fructose-bisphosphate aldolase class I
MVPIVEPEVLMDGSHDMARCAEVTEAAQTTLFAALRRHNVRLEAVILKPNMVLPGKDLPRPTPEECAEETLKVLRRTVPAAVPSINFLSGGQTAEEATANLNAMNQLDGPKPWVLSFSYSRALQNPVQAAWNGNAANREAAQQAFLKRARLNSLARKGEYATRGSACGGYAAGLHGGRGPRHRRWLEHSVSGRSTNEQRSIRRYRRDARLAPGGACVLCQPSRR